MQKLGSLLAVTLLLSACGGGEKPSAPLPEAEGALTLTSPAFPDGEAIPRRHTCDGDGSSPPLAWSGVLPGARELALVVEDRDADGFVHWTVLGIAASQTEISEGSVPAGSVETDNSSGEPGWSGPCPPEGDGPHHYVFALYATGERLHLDQGSSPDEVRERLAEHALARGVLTGVYARGD